MGAIRAANRPVTGFTETERLAVLSYEVTLVAPQAFRAQRRAESRERSGLVKKEDSSRLTSGVWS